MSRWLIVLLIIVIVALFWYWQRERTRQAEQRQADEARRLTASSAASRAPLPAATEREVAREAGTLQRAADVAAGVGLEQKTAQIEEMTADLAAARREADLAAARRTAEADAALAAVQAAAAHGGAVPGDGTAECPEDYPIKGSIPSNVYHEPGQLAYSRVVAEVCFQSATAAEAAGFASADAAPVLVEEMVIAEEAEAPNTPEAAFAEALVAPESASGERGDVVAEAIAAADAGGVPPGAIRGDGGRDCPPAYPIKGNQSSLLYHEPGTPTYQSTIPEFCFSSVESAVAAGFHATAG